MGGYSVMKLQTWVEGRRFYSWTGGLEEILIGGPEILEASPGDHGILRLIVLLELQFRGAKTVRGRRGIDREHGVVTVHPMLRDGDLEIRRGDPNRNEPAVVVLDRLTPDRQVQLEILQLQGHIHAVGPRSLNPGFRAHVEHHPPDVQDLEHVVAVLRSKRNQDEPAAQIVLEEHGTHAGGKAALLETTAL